MTFDNVLKSCDGLCERRAQRDPFQRMLPALARERGDQPAGRVKDIRAVTPLVQSRPKFAGCSLSPVTLTTRPSLTDNTIPQPTPQ